MRYYRYSEDWVTYLEGDFENSLIATLRRLPVKKLQKYPPPKVAGLPIGNEMRVISRFLRGKSSQLDPSALSNNYRSLMADDLDLVYRAFRANDFLPRELWLKLLDEVSVDTWIEKKCLHPDEAGKLRCEFSVICVDGLLFVTDPLKDHGTLWEPDFVFESGNVSDSAEIRPFFHVYIGLDSLRMIEIMERGPLPARGRYLDCGPGSGGLLLYFGRHYDTAVGIDINARAVVLSNFNARLNELPNVAAYNDDAMRIGERYGRFDLISWNLPFVFMPAEGRDRYVDAFGGELGIGFCLDFISTIGEFLAENGTAYIAAMAPIRQNGENVLEARLETLLPRIMLDCDVQVAQVAVAHNKELWDFHQGHGLEKFESVYLKLTHGSGKLTRTESPFPRRVTDSVRERIYKRKYSAYKR